MKRHLKLFFGTLLLTCTVSVPAHSQKPPKIDSLLILLPKPKAEVMDLVLAAFTQAGLSITDQTTSLVTADLGSNDNILTGVRFVRVVRALILSRDSTTTVLITGDETRHMKEDNNRQLRRLRIDNHAGGHGEKAWRMMVAAAMLLDSTQVPAAAIKPPRKNP